ncbi:MAG: cell division protein FtsQ/DivIB [bacterium]
MGGGVGPTNKRQRERSWFDDISWPENIPVSRDGLRYVLRFSFVLLMVGLLFFIGYDFYRYTYSSGRYDVTLDVTGAKAVPVSEIRSEVMEFSRDGKSLNLLSVDVNKVRNKLMSSISRFKSVHVRKQYPNQLHVKVEERKPYMLVGRQDPEGGQRIFLPADTEGVLFEAQPSERERIRQELPAVIGLETEQHGTSGYKSKWKRSKNVYKTFRAYFVRDMLDWIRVYPGGYVELQVNQPRRVRVKLGVGNYEAKFRKLKKMIGTEEFQQINNYVNLSDLDEILVK